MLVSYLMGKFLTNRDVSLPPTSLILGASGWVRRKCVIDPLGIQALIKQTDMVAETPRNGTTFGCRRDLHRTTSL